MSEQHFHEINQKFAEEMQQETAMNHLHHQDDESKALAVLNTPTTLADALIASNITNVVSNIADAVEAGSISPLKALAAIKKLEAIADAATNKDPKKNILSDRALLIHQCFMDEASLHPEKKFGAFGATFTKTEVGTKYDWSQCNDHELIELESLAKSAAERLKERQDFLKSIPSAGLPMVNQETGEAYTIYPPSKTSTSSISVSFK